MNITKERITKIVKTFHNEASVEFYDGVAFFRVILPLVEQIDPEDILFWLTAIDLIESSLVQLGYKAIPRSWKNGWCDFYIEDKNFAKV
jgi:hypothetical protein